MPRGHGQQGEGYDEWKAARPQERNAEPNTSIPSPLYRHNLPNRKDCPFHLERCLVGGSCLAAVGVFEANKQRLPAIIDCVTTRDLSAGS